MHKNTFLTVFALFFSAFFIQCVASPKYSTPENSKANTIYYTRCNLKVIKGTNITWVNWQSVADFIPVGTAVKVDRNGSKATLTNVEKGKTYTLDIGSDGDVFIEKFITKEPLNINKLSQDIQFNIGNAVARFGMTKEQVYIAMGPPAVIFGVKTNNKTYEEIMDANLWIYKRRRLGKNIGVAFDPFTALVNRTEGIWR